MSTSTTVEDLQEYTCVQAAAVAENKNRRHRRKMEDAHVLLNGVAGDDKQGLFCVFDGHGGDKVAKWAGENFANVLQEKLAERGDSAEDWDSLWADTYAECDAQIKEETSMQYSGTTAVTCLVWMQGEERVLHTANAGDARAVLLSGDDSTSLTAKRLTEDHKPSDDSETKRITDAGGFVKGGRVLGMLAVSRALGDHTMKDFVVSTPSVSQHVLDAKAKDHFLVVACDGVWDVFSDDQLADFVAQADDQSVEALAKAIVDASIERGSTDNITCVVVQL